MAGLISAMQRHQGRSQALQAQAVRVAIWGEAAAYADFVGALMDAPRQTGAAPDGLDASLRAFGLRISEEA